MIQFKCEDEEDAYCLARSLKERLNVDCRTTIEDPAVLRTIRREANAIAKWASERLKQKVAAQ